MTNTAVVVTESVMDATEARALTERIKSSAEQLWKLILEAHERRAWKALGYPSWREYAKTEFGMGQSHVYRLLDQGRVVRALEAAAHSPVGEIPERVARDLKPHLVEVTADIRSRIADGEAPQEAIQTVISEARKSNSYLGSRKRTDRPNRWLETVALDLAFTWLDGDPSQPLNLQALDRERLPEWIDVLRRAAKSINRLAARLEEHVEEPVEHCHRRGGAR